MSRLGSLYITLGSPDGELPGCCELNDWAAIYIEQLQAELSAMTQAKDDAADRAFHSSEAHVKTMQLLQDVSLERDELAFSWSGCATQLKDACEDLDQCEQSYADLLLTLERAKADSETTILALSKTVINLEDQLAKCRHERDALKEANEQLDDLSYNHVPPRPRS